MLFHNYLFIVAGYNLIICLAIEGDLHFLEQGKGKSSCIYSKTIGEGTMQLVSVASVSSKEITSSFHSCPSIVVF